MSSVKRRMARAGAKNPQAAQILSLLSTLTPGLQKVESQLQEVARLTPELQQTQVEWETTLAMLKQEVADTQRQQDQSQAVHLMLLYEVLTGSLSSTMSFEEFVAHSQVCEKHYRDTDEP